MIFAVDFDGTIVEHDFPDIGVENPKAIYTLVRLQELGHKIVLWTCREGSYLDEALSWCLARGFTPDAVNENVDKIVSFATRKIYADVYIDDRSWPPFKSWKRVLADFTSNKEAA